MALSRTLATCLFVFGLIAVFAQDEREMPIPRKLETKDSRKMSHVPAESEPVSTPSRPKNRQIMRYIPPSSSPKNSIPNDSKGKQSDTRRNLSPPKPESPPRELQRYMRVERTRNTLAQLDNEIIRARAELQNSETRLRALQAQQARAGPNVIRPNGDSPSGAGPNRPDPRGAGPGGAGPSGAGPSGAHRSRL